MIVKGLTFNGGFSMAAPEPPSVVQFVRAGSGSGTLQAGEYAIGMAYRTTGGDPGTGSGWDRIDRLTTNRFSTYIYAFMYTKNTPGAFSAPSGTTMQWMVFSGADLAAGSGDSVLGLHAVEGTNLLTNNSLRLRHADRSLEVTDGSSIQVAFTVIAGFTNHPMLPGYTDVTVFNTPSSRLMAMGYRNLAPGVTSTGNRQTSTGNNAFAGRSFVAEIRAA